jgi:HEAT repeat protein
VANIEEKRLKTTATGPVDEKSGAAKKVLASLLLTRKHYSLYPEDHTICVNALEHLHTQAETYLRNYGDLRFEVEKDQIISQGEIILTEPPEEGTLSFTLFRDGIRWLEISGGIDSEELKKFISIINKYSILSDKSDSDIVTALWESRFLHVKYEVADFSWGADQEATSTPSPDSGRKIHVAHQGNLSADWTPQTDPPIDQAAVMLTQQEKVMMLAMVRTEESRASTAYLNALFDSLLQYREQDNFKVIIKVLAEEFKNSMAQGDFSTTLEILENLQYVLDICKVDMIPKAVQFIESFFLIISSPQSLAPLKDSWPNIDASRFDKIKRFFKFLQPEAISTLVLILQQHQSVQLQQLLIEVITSLASRDIRPLESLLKSPDEKLVQSLINVLAGLKGEQPLKILMSLVRHPSERVRQEALKGIFQRDTSHLNEIFNLIDDKDESIRRLILKHMGQSRNPAAERFLLKYLENQISQNAQNDHVIACFTTLGLCGSSRSIPFLRRNLFGAGFFSSFGKKAYRMGAAVALSKIGTNEARQVLEDACRSFYPSVRGIARKVIK